MGIWKYSGQMIKTESIRKLSNFNCQWAKTLCQIISIILNFVLPFSRAINVTSYKKSLQRHFLCGPEKTNFKCFKFHERKSYARWFYTCTYVNSIPVKFETYFLRLRWAFYCYHTRPRPWPPSPGLTCGAFTFYMGLFNELNLF